MWRSLIPSVSSAKNQVAMNPTNIVCGCVINILVESTTPKNCKSVESVVCLDIKSGPAPQKNRAKVLARVPCNPTKAPETVIMKIYHLKLVCEKQERNAFPLLKKDDQKIVYEASLKR